MDYKNECPDGFTMGMWLRGLLSTGSGLKQFLRNSHGLSLRFSEDEFLFVVSFRNDFSKCILLENYKLESAVKEWYFVTLTYRPADNTFHCAFNVNQPTLGDQFKTRDSPLADSPPEIQVGGSFSFLLDDFVFFERSSTDAQLKELYETSK